MNLLKKFFYKINSEIDQDPVKIHKKLPGGPAHVGAFFMRF